MGAVLGIAGEGNLDELKAMAARMAYRGAQLCVLQPAPGILLGELRHQAGALDATANLCLDANGALYPRDAADRRSASIADAEDRLRLARELRERGTAALADVSGHFALA